MKQNKFRILIASYNNEDWVEYNIASVLNQTYENYHVTYIDDFSQDNTFEKVKALVGNSSKFTLIKNESNLGGSYNHIRFFNSFDDDDVIVLLDGDDWFFDDHVLENLNNAYNEKDLWMTYGKFYVYNGTEHVSEADPQNSPYPEFIHKHKLYRKDIWRASHLRTYKSFLIKKVDQDDYISKINGKLFWHAADLSLAFPCLEMCPQEKIGVVDFPTYIYNASPKSQERTKQREISDNNKYEIEIRNKKRYKEGLSGEKLPNINVIGDFRERNSIAKSCSYVYNAPDYIDYEATIIQDMDCIKYINREFNITKGKIIADIHEPPHLFEQKQVYDKVYENAHMFDLILTYDNKLLQLSNAKFRNGGGECVLNKNVHSLEYPNIANENLYNIYAKKDLISIITSNKTFTEGHRFRVKCVNHLIAQNSKIDLFGVGYKEIKGKINALASYCFSVAMENGIHKNYFTEKILDCFLTGTIPVYKGCENISEFFDENGIIIFEDEKDLQQIIDSLSIDLYYSKLEYVKKNYELALKYKYNNEDYFNKYIKDII